MMHKLKNINNSRLGQYLHTVFPQLKISVFSLVLFIMQSVFSVAARHRDALDSTGFDGRAGALKMDWAKPLHCS